MTAMAQAKTDILRLVRANIRDLLAYEPIEPAEVLAQRMGVAAIDIAKLDGNENPYGPSPKVLKALGSYSSYDRYGDPGQRALRQALGEYAGVGPEHVVAGHGADELIDLIIRAVIEPGEAVIDCPPTFGMYAFSTRVQGGEVVQVPRSEDFSLDIDALRAAAPRAKLLIVASPNNPTGNPMSMDELESLLDTGLLVVIDEAYVEFGGASVASLAPLRENLVVLRTFSKWAGLAGLRAGYAVMPRALAGVLMHMKPPYTPNVAAEIALIASLEEKDELSKNVEKIIAERERLRAKLDALEFVDVYPSQGNFLLCRLPGMSGREVRDRLAKNGVFIRFFDTPRLQDCVRISVGLPEQTDRVIQALQQLGGERGS
jgi:histidinol-phosphate aminotransferase